MTQRFYTQDEDAYLRAHYRKDFAKQIGEHLGRSKNSIIGRARMLRLHVPKLEFVRRTTICNRENIFTRAPRVVARACPKREKYAPPLPPRTPAEAAAAAIIAQAHKTERYCNSFRGRQ